MADKGIVARAKVEALVESIRAKTGITGPLSFDAMKTAVDGIQTGGGGDSNLNPTWWDIEKILREDTENYKYKAIYLIDDDDESTGINTFVEGTNHIDLIKTSDGSVYKNTLSSYINHVWDKTKDKPCYDKKGNELYKTRYFILYSDDEGRLKNPFNSGKHYIYACIKGFENALSLMNVSESSFPMGLERTIGIKNIDDNALTIESLNVSQQNIKILPLLKFQNGLANIDMSYLMDIQSIDDFIYYENNVLPSQRINMNYCYRLLKLPILDFENAVPSNSTSLFGLSLSYCIKLREVKLKNTRSFTTFPGRYNYCYNLERVEGIDIINAISGGSPFTNCFKLCELEIRNIKVNLQVGSGTSYGHMLTLDSLISLCKECVNTGSALTLTVGSANLDKIQNSGKFYKFVDPSITGVAVGEKGEIEECESSVTGSFSISDFMAMKNWTLA